MLTKQAKADVKFADRSLPYLKMVLIERIDAFIENLYTGSWSDDELGRLLTSLETLHNAEHKYPKRTRCNSS